MFFNDSFNFDLFRSLESLFNSPKGNFIQIVYRKSKDNTEEKQQSNEASDTTEPVKVLEENFTVDGKEYVCQLFKYYEDGFPMYFQKTEEVKNPDLEELNAELRKLAEAERFEDCIALRDKINELKRKQSQPANNTPNK
jgi:excinuclease UvrABC helicase subunit UvrB